VIRAKYRRYRILDGRRVLLRARQAKFLLDHRWGRPAPSIAATIDGNVRGSSYGAVFRRWGCGDAPLEEAPRRGRMF
jgi:hypothetical protein